MPESIYWLLVLKPEAVKAAHLIHYCEPDRQWQKTESCPLFLQGTNWSILSIAALIYMEYTEYFIQ